jgi:NADPH-dependent 2,4-dienoyl-CoA reductase/sulfur reductase-like enzyme
MVCIGVGIRPATKLAEDAGLEIDNGIKVNSYLETSDPDVYAAGDVANYPDKLFSKRRRVEHWAHARLSGRIAGENMSGARREYDLLSHVWSDIFDLHLEFAGDESENDETILRGKLEDESFVVLYLKDTIAKAYFAINAAPEEIGELNKLLLSKRSLGDSKEKLKDKDFAIEKLSK